MPLAIAFWAITLSVLGWCAFGFNVSMFLDHARGLLDPERLGLRRAMCWKVIVVVGAQGGWAFTHPTFNKLHLVWMFFVFRYMVVTLLGNWFNHMQCSFYGIEERPPTPMLPALTTTLILQAGVLWLLT